MQGLPWFLTLTGSTIVSHATISARQTGGYYYRGAVVSDTLLGDAGVITRLLALGAIQ